VRTADFDFDLPPELIAQHPAPNRDCSRLLVLHRATGKVEHQLFTALPNFLRVGDVLVLNDTKVLPARLRGYNPRTGGLFELLLLEENAVNDWWVMVRPGRRARLHTRIRLQQPGGAATDVEAEFIDHNAEGYRRLLFTGTQDICEILGNLGEVPLPPYIKREPGQNLNSDVERYQTVYAQRPGSVAAPTAGLHFTDAVLSGLRDMGVEVCYLTLHIGPGTFAPVKAERLSDHVMHEERFDLPPQTAQCIERARAEGRRVVTVGSTSVRVLESVAARQQGVLLGGSGRTGIFIYPPFRFRVVDVLLTNFHLPRSTLLMLVSAFASPGAERGRWLVLSAYAQAVEQRYRFFSYGDAMLII
jgi:S-adenosylmethionine:tRNA ribosyltransferase-isomerase